MLSWLLLRARLVPGWLAIWGLADGALAVPDCLAALAGSCSALPGRPIASRATIGLPSLTAHLRFARERRPGSATPTHHGGSFGETGQGHRPLSRRGQGG